MLAVVAVTVMHVLLFGLHVCVLSSCALVCGDGQENEDSVVFLLSDANAYTCYYLN